MGGMAEILLARVKEPASPEQLVVLKRMHRQLAVDREYVKMFMDEARIATTLRHPNVVEVYEIGEDGDQYYIAMEYLHGHDLRRVLSRMARQRIPMRLGHALAIARGVCRGLDYTHERTDADGDLLGIVHRDVSPHNVLLTYNGRVKLVDFGIAKTSMQASRTRTGILKGKVAYMSPEQAMGDTLDRRSDVFCIGILLWEMTTGQWLYRRKSELETLKAVVENDAPRPSHVLPGYPLELEQIVMKTLARKREERWTTAGELGEALTAFAKRRRLDLAPAALSSLMSAAFSDEVAAWQEARGVGTSLGDHLVSELDRQASGREIREVGDRDSPAAPTLEDLPTTVVPPPQRPRPEPVWERVWEQLGERRNRVWVAAGAAVALGLIGWLASAVLHRDPEDVAPAPPPPAAVTEPAASPPAPLPPAPSPRATTSPAAKPLPPPPVTPINATPTPATGGATVPAGGSPQVHPAQIKPIPARPDPAPAAPMGPSSVRSSIPRGASPPVPGNDLGSGAHAKPALKEDAPSAEKSSGDVKGAAGAAEPPAESRGKTAPPVAPPAEPPTGSHE